MSTTPPVPASPAALAHGWRRLARSDAAPWLHQEVARRMADKLQLIRLQPQRWADWWAFGGGGTQALRQHYPQAAGLLIEPTAGLLQKHEPSSAGLGGKLRNWLGRGPQLQRQLDGDALEPGGVDLVWANLVVHAVQDPQALFDRWHAALRTDGFVMFSALGPDTLREWKALNAAAGGAPLTLDFLDMHDLGDMLVHAGFADPVMDMERITLTWGDAQAMLSDLRACGVNANPWRFPGLRTPRWREGLIDLLNRELRGADGRLHLSFEVIYGHAVKPLPRIKMALQTEVSLDAMRQMIRSK